MGEFGSPSLSELINEELEEKIAFLKRRLFIATVGKWISMGVCGVAIGNLIAVFALHKVWVPIYLLIFGGTAVSLSCVIFGDFIAEHCKWIPKANA